MRMQSKKENFYKPDTRKATIFAGLLAILSLALFFTFAWMSTRASDKRMRERELVEDYLCTTQTPCMLTLTADYDKEPIEAYLIGPDGTKYGPRELDGYQVSDSQIIMELYSEQSGDWKVGYNQLTNNKINFSIVQSYAEKLFITDMEFVKGKTTGAYYLEFVPLYKDGKDSGEKLHCSVTLEKLPGGEKAGIVYNGEVTLNKKARLQLDTENFPEGEYYLSVSTKSGTAVSGNTTGNAPDTNDPMFAQKRVTVTLGESLSRIHTVSGNDVANPETQEGGADDGSTGSED